MKKILKKLKSERPNKIKVSLTDIEYTTLKKISHDQNISVEHVLRQGLKTYAIVHEEFSKESNPS